MPPPPPTPPPHNSRPARPPHVDLSMNSQAVVSLGTLVTAFVAKPLANLPNPTNPSQKKFQEVQVYFYNFNNKAGMMSRCNIAQFPVFTDFFAREYARVRMESSSRAVNFTVSEFIGFLANKIIDDPMNPAYNIQELYNTVERRSRDGEANQLQYVRDGHGRSISSDEYNRRLERIMLQPEIGNVTGSPDFVMPQVTFEIEALPSAADLTQTILKIHIFDKTCSPNSSLRDLLDASVNTTLSAITAVPPDQSAAQQTVDAQYASEVGAAGGQAQRGARRGARPADAPAVTATKERLQQNWREIYNDIIEKAKNDGLIEQVGDRYFFVGGAAKLKRMVMRYMPHIIYGAMGTNVKSANMSSKQDPLLSTMNMQRSLNSNPIMPNGAQVGGVPLSIYPVDLSMTTLGCPFLRFSQEMFIDFNTNTTADNIYYVMGLSHRFEAGTYETTIKFTANDAFGKFRSFSEQINNGIQHINNITDTVPPPIPSRENRNHNRQPRTRS